MYVYNTDINKSNPNKLLRSLAHGEVVQFDVVLSMEKLHRRRTLQVSMTNQLRVPNTFYGKHDVICFFVLSP